MRELSMFYNKINILLAFLSCALIFTANQVSAQGLVSLSEEAMFDDGLETLPEEPAQEVPLLQSSAGTEVALPAQTVAQNAPVAAPQAPADNVPRVSEKTDAVLPEMDEEPNSIFNTENSNDDIADQDLFTQMSDLERRTALLNLELRREKLQNEIESVKNQRRQALQQEQDKIEQQKLKNLEFEKEQEKKVLVEQQKLRELDIKFENLRQEKILNAYKNQMLEENQKWIANNANFYKQIADLRDSKKAMAQNLKEQLEILQKEALSAKEVHNNKINAYKKEVDDLQAQISVLRKRIDTVEKENQEMKQNPFASPEAVQPVAQVADNEQETDNDGVFEGEPTETDLSKLYAVTEIRGQGNELIAKLINKNGTAFYVKKGTALQTGHIIGDITTTYVSAERDGDKSYLYFSAGGIVPVETSEFKVENTGAMSANQNTAKGGPVAGSL